MAHRPLQQNENSLSELNVVVVGAGPGGLTFGRLAHLLGANVTIFEKLDDPCVSQREYTDRSFNLSIDRVGRQALGDSRAWAESKEVRGRAMHDFGGTGKTLLTSYGPESEDILNNIPRTVLRTNLVKLAVNAGVRLVFNTSVMDVDPEIGKVTYVSRGQREYLTADLIVIADGLHSVADALISTYPDAVYDKRPEPRNYFSVTIGKEALGDSFSPDHIHFWHEPGREAFAVGLPNLDESISLLLVSRFDGIQTDEHPFGDPLKAQRRLQQDFPKLLAIDPTLPERLGAHPRGRLVYKILSKVVFGERTVVIGDAAVAFPPWAGFGTNLALHHASTLCRSLQSAHGDVAAGLRDYETYESILGKLVTDYADEHGDFLNHGVLERPHDRPSGSALAELIARAQAEANAGSIMNRTPVYAGHNGQQE